MSIKRRKAYDGSKPRLVVAFDVGTTYSAISYTILTPGEVPDICSVTRFPGQEIGNSKIPTIIYYDDQGEARSIGAEALQPRALDDAENEGWFKAEWFKLHLRPKHLTLDINDDSLPPLPPNKTAVDVFGDFLRYLRGCTRKYIQETHASGVDLWQSLVQDTQFVLSHPNGWRGLQQSQMRRAAVSGGLISNDRDGHSRLHFVTDGEAGLHFCLGAGFASDLIKSGQGIMIVDAGGGTVDLGTYCMNVSENVFEEIAPSECLLQGSTYVTRRAKEFLKDKLNGSSYGSHEQVNDIAEVFDKSTKRLFKNRDEPCFIKFGARRDQDPQFGIINGRLKLTGNEVAGFFEPSIRAIMATIEELLPPVRPAVSAIMLVGGFAASNWLFSNMQSHLKHRSLALCRPDNHVNKPVAHGAVSFYLDHLVSIRVSHFDYAMNSRSAFYPIDTRHQASAGCFDVLTRKGNYMNESTEIIRDFRRTRGDRLQLYEVSEDIFYNGSGQGLANNEKAFKVLCTVQADTSKFAETLLPQISPSGTYYALDFKIILRFGFTELNAEVSWIEHGTEKRLPATIVYRDPGDPEERSHQQAGGVVPLRARQPPFHCVLCLEDHPADDIARIEKCGHPFCKDCIHGYISSKLSEHRFPITCPICSADETERNPGVITDLLVQQIELTEKEREIWFELEMAMFSVLIHCQKCERAAFVDRHDHQEALVLPCPFLDCDHLWCKFCQQSVAADGPQHSCDGSSELDHLMKERGWKYCPDCKTPIMKDEGCNHITCRSPGCTMHFCYVCGEAITGSVSSQEISAALQVHYEKCRLHD